VSWLRPVGSTGLQVSALGLGTVKLGRNEGVKYPSGFNLPDDASAARLLDQAWDLGINLLDTAPAYGSSEQRLGQLLAATPRDWIICSKVGEEFKDGLSSHDFSPEHCRFSVERSLNRLGVDAIDLILVHSDGNDLAIINELGTLEALDQLKKEGKIRGFGISTKSVEGGIAAASRCDALMVTYNLAHREDEVVMDECAKQGSAVLLKKVFASGHLNKDVEDPVAASMEQAFSHAATTSAIIGTITPAHLQANVAAALTAIKAG
jgi:aryl-alcohol dehydrogenase-like predicted oxidoreductase